MTETLEQEPVKGFWRRRKWTLLGVLLAVAVVGGVAAWVVVATGNAQEGREAPEAARVLSLQAKTPFQILVPAYLPKDFDRANAIVDVQPSGPAGELMAEITYKTSKGAELHIREWVPPNKKLETLASSRTIQTKWGTGWLLSHINMYAIWADIGPTRVSVFTSSIAAISREKLLGITDSLGPATNTQVFTFAVEQQAIKDVPPAPPYSPPVNSKGVQEFTLVITPGGYDPIRIALRKGVPARLIFRQLGEVGCGNNLVFPTDPANPRSLTLRSSSDSQTLEFTPQVAGEFPFRCGHQMYRGIVTVLDK